jgi:hypothetical protein
MTRHNNNLLGTGDASGPDAITPTLGWDDSKARTLYPNVAQVKAKREEVMLLFGKIRQSDEHEIHAQLDERVIMSPFVAKRLLVKLMDVIQQVEAAYGVPNRKGVPQNQEQTKSLLDLPPFRFRITADRVMLLFQLLKDLNLPAAFERSFKLSQGILFGGRFLVGIKKHMIRTDPTAKILEICRRMDMPQDLMGRFTDMLPDAMVVGFGFSENETTCVVKAYLEFINRYGEAGNKETDKPYMPDSYLSHAGFKWDAADNSRNTLARYTRYPLLGTEEMLERISAYCYGQNVGRPLTAVEGIVNLASKKTGSKALYYIEVKEENNPRASFDINIYNANLPLESLHTFFLDMCRHYSISDGQFSNLYDPLKNKICGQIGGGKDGKGQDYLTVYFGD